LTLRICGLYLLTLYVPSIAQTLRIRIAALIDLSERLVQIRRVKHLASFEEALAFLKKQIEAEDKLKAVGQE